LADGGTPPVVQFSFFDLGAPSLAGLIAGRTLNFGLGLRILAALRITNECCRVF